MLLAKEEILLDGHRLIAPLIDGPGLWLWSGIDIKHERVLIELQVLKAPAGDDDWNARLFYERFLGALTESLSAAGSEILAHGGTDDGNERVLFWVLPWIPGIDAVNARPQPRSWVDLAWIGLSLSERLVARHDREAFDPQLTEFALVSGGYGAQVRVAGVPVVFEPKWLAPSRTPTRLAPEETPVGQPTKQGDLWRLGSAMQVLAATLPGEPPPALATLLRAICEPDPRRRLRRACDVANELEAIIHDLEPARLADRATRPTKRAEDTTLDDIRQRALEDERGHTHLNRDTKLDLQHLDDQSETVDGPRSPLSASAMEVPQPPEDSTLPPDDPTLRQLITSRPPPPKVETLPPRPSRPPHKPWRPTTIFWIVSSVLGIAVGAGLSVLLRIL